MRDSKIFKWMKHHKKYKDHFECVDLEYVPEYRNLAELNAEFKEFKALEAQSYEEEEEE